MKGSIRKKGKYSWQICVDIGTGSDGKRRRVYETVRSNRKQEAQRRLNELLVSLNKGAYTPPGHLTLKGLLNDWLEGYVKTNCSQKTLDGYRVIVEKHLIPDLGHIKIKELKPQDIQGYYGRACEKFSPRTGERLSPRTVHHQHRVLSQALNYAIKQGYLLHNPCGMVSPPKPRRKPMRTLTPSELEVLLKNAQDSQFYPIIYTAASSGIRQAELLGLCWRSLDPDITMSISINRTLYKRKGVIQFNPPKTRHSCRRVNMTPKLACFLREYRAERERLYQQMGKQLNLDCLVFANPEGTPIDPSVLSHSFARIVKGINLEGVRFHDLRHTFASLMLLRGAPAKVITEALGHSSVAFTMDVYSHIIEGMQEEAMALLDEVLPVGVYNKTVAKLSPIVDIKL